MGAVKKIFKVVNPIALMSSAFKSPKQDTSAQDAQRAELAKREADAKAQDDAAAKAQKDEEEKKARLLALKQGGLPGQLTPSGGAQGEATTARKKLLGL